MESKIADSRENSIKAFEAHQRTGMKRKKKQKQMMTGLGADPGGRDGGYGCSANGDG